MSGLSEVDCSGCGRHHTLSAEQARKQRVVRCACGQFVRMDRALIEQRSEPAPAPRVELSEARPGLEAELGSLAKLPVLAHPPRVAQASLSGTERKSELPAATRDSTAAASAPRATLASGHSGRAASAHANPPGPNQRCWPPACTGFELRCSHGARHIAASDRRRRSLLQRATALAHGLAGAAIVRRRFRLGRVLGSHVARASATTAACALALAVAGRGRPLAR